MEIKRSFRRGINKLAIKTKNYGQSPIQSGSTTPVSMSPSGISPLEESDSYFMSIGFDNAAVDPARSRLKGDRSASVSTGASSVSHHDTIHSAQTPVENLVTLPDTPLTPVEPLTGMIPLLPELSRSSTEPEQHTQPDQRSSEEKRADDMAQKILAEVNKAKDGDGWAI